MTRRIAVLLIAMCASMACVLAAAGQEPKSKLRVDRTTQFDTGFGSLGSDTRSGPSYPYGGAASLATCGVDIAKNSSASRWLCARHRSSMLSTVALPPRANGLMW